MRLRFSLRTLFVVMTLIAALFGWRSFNLARAHDLADSIVAGDYRRAQHDIANAPWISEALNSLDANNQVAPEVSAHVISTGAWRNWWLPSLRIEISSAVEGETVTAGPFHTLSDPESHSLKAESIGFSINQSLRGF
jgi:hypothetical protein